MLKRSFIVFICALALTLLGCETEEKYAVMFMVDGGAYSSGYVDADSLIVFPKEPEKEGYDFAGWYIGDTPADENTRITDTTILHARWTPADNENTQKPDAGGNSSVEEPHVHEESEWMIKVAPGCTDTGCEEKICISCGEVLYTKVIEVLGHEFKINYEFANCMNPEIIKSTCIRCGCVELETAGAPLGHSFGEWSITKEATCSDEGERLRSCAICGMNDTAVIGMKAHSMGSAVPALSGRHTVPCTACGYAETEDCEYQREDILPSCTSDGIIRYTCHACKSSYDEIGEEARGHSYEMGECTSCGAMLFEFLLSVTGDYYILQDVRDTTVRVAQIPEIYNGKPVREIAQLAFFGCSGLSSVFIPSSVNVIGRFAFRGCSSLTRAEFAEPDGWVCREMPLDTENFISIQDLEPQTAALYLTDEEDGYAGYYFIKIHAS